MPAYLLDIIFGLVLLFCTFSCYRRGFARTILSFLAVLVSAVTAGYATRYTVQLIYDRFIKTALYESILEKVTSVFGGGEISAGLVNVELFLPKFISGLVGGSSAATGDALTDTYEKIADSVLTTYAEPIVTSILCLILFMVIFGIISAILSSVVRVVGRGFNVPIIGGINRLLGAVLGFSYGIMLCVLLAAAALFFIGMTADSSIYMNTNIINGSYFAKLFFNNNPIIRLIA